MMRYLRLYLYFLRFSFSRAMVFRVDFGFRIFMDIVWNLVNLGFFWVLYQHTPLLGGWTCDQMLVFLGGVFVYDAINMPSFRATCGGCPSQSIAATLTITWCAPYRRCSC
jgi:ABC-2 type transport system permease protein